MATPMANEEAKLPSSDGQTMERTAESQTKPTYDSPWGPIEIPTGEDGFYKSFMNPMLDDMEKTVAKSTAMLDKLNQDMELDRKKRYKKLVQSHIPEELKGGGKDEADVMKLVDQLLFYEEVGDGNEVQLNDEAQLTDLDEASKLTVTAHSLAAHFTMLEPGPLGRASSKLSSDCRLWLSRLFRFKDSMPVYHDKRFEGLARVGQLALYTRYPKYATEGFEALYSRPPVIYISAVAPPGLGQYLCQQLGLPLSCVCTVPCNTVFGASSKMDVAMLEKLIQDDIAAAKTPVLLVAYAGTPIVGHVDNLQRLQEIAKTNNIWLHVEGNNLATLTLFSVPTSVESAVSGDSLTLDLSKWLGVPALPYITLFKDSDATLTEAAGLTSIDTRLQLKCLPLWMCLQSLGHEGMVNKIKHSCDLAKILFDQLDQLTTIKQISREKKKQEKEPKNVTDLIFKAINALMVFEIVTPTVVFKYCEDTAAPGAVVAPYSGMKVDDDSSQEVDAVYFDALNTWLAEALVVANPRVPIDLVEVDKEGVCIRYAPLETAQSRGTKKEDIENFVESLKSNLSVLNATTVERKKFQTTVNANPNLKLVDLDSWAGLGAVSYIPEPYASQGDEVPESAKTEVNNLNAELVHKLKAQDTAFSTGHSAEGMVCVRFGLITSDTDVEELVSLVYSVGREVEESSKYLESMSQVIRKGIEEANKELAKENTEKLMHEGVLRQVPVVSSLLNWFSPAKEDIKGRTFNLASGKISRTTDTYKYRMQVQEDGSGESAPPPENPPPANEPAPLKGILKTPPQSNGELPAPAADDQPKAEVKTAGEVKAQLASQSSAPSSPTQQSLPDVVSAPQSEAAAQSQTTTGAS
ncbi:putative pyridoxal-dependent decarboxylase domain-containing protein 2 [Aplysia californica]|uniref:Pyridoxal-dependent decarboxylase domain-containing protein 1 n=1 Tax=Aplysia californica TaxID=6500 RepID=A0ABM0K7Z1_APLCA|nr:putative pyridoxal-dependent decarboxylase domain-containing protein 2 [Aplysia californica]